MNIIVRSMVLIILFLSACSTTDGKHDRSKDRHYTKIGFFDIHYCNWPDRKPFNMVLFSTTHFKLISKIEIFSPDNLKLGELDLTQYRLITRKNKPVKRVFITQMTVDENFKAGWYKTTVTLIDGKTIDAYDYVKYTLMGIVNKTVPQNGSEDVALPEVLRWDKPKGLTYYQVYIKDMWQDGKLIHSSKLLDTNKLTLPKGLLQAGGYYSWRVHSRDINEDPILGDFNHGSLSKEFYFTVNE